MSRMASSSSIRIVSGCGPRAVGDDENARLATWGAAHTARADEDSARRDVAWRATRWVMVNIVQGKGMSITRRRILLDILRDRNV